VEPSEAVGAIKNAGGRDHYEWERSKEKPAPGGKPWAPKWLVDLIGVDYFGHVTNVRISSESTETDAAMVQVGRLSRLKRLDLDAPSFGDAEMTNRKGLTNLSELTLQGTQVTDAGLAHLKGLTNLSCLDLDGTQVTNVGLAHLKGLINLE